MIFSVSLSHTIFCCCSVSQSCPILCDPMDCSTPGTSPPCPSPSPGVCSKLVSIESVMPYNHLILCCPLLLLLSIFPSIRVFSNELTLHVTWPKNWSFSLSISPSNEYSGLISFRIDWFDLAVQGTLKSLLQDCSSKALILWHSAFFMAQLSHPYITIGKAIALTIWTFDNKFMFFLFNMLSRFVITFLPRSSFWFHGCSRCP